MGMSGVRCLQWQCQFSEKEVIHIFFPSQSVSRRHGSFHPLKHKHRREPAASTWARRRLTTNVSYVYCVWVYGGNALFSTQHVCFCFFTFQKGYSPPSSGLSLLPLKGDRKSESQLHTTSQPHATCGAV